MTTINNLIIFGDSLSDIGNKRVSFFGGIARAFGLMRVNQVGRFSDNKNWTDFIWEWSGGTSMFQTDQSNTNNNTAHHAKLTANSSNGAPGTNAFSYANYSEGGAMGASDRPSTGLGVFKSQYAQFVKEATALNKQDETFLFLVWFGMNDLVTNKRDPNDMGPVADEICELCKKILTQFPNSHFLIGNLLNPKTAVRYASTALNSNLTPEEEAANLTKEEKVKVDELNGFYDGALQFSFDLPGKAALIKHGEEQRARVVDVMTYMDDIDENANKYGLTSEDQPKGVGVRYNNEAPPTKNVNGKECGYATTSDKAHPTEAIYKLIANVWAQSIDYYPVAAPLPNASNKPNAGQELVLGTLANSGETRFTVAE